MFLFLYLEVADAGLACASAMPMCACSMLHVPFHASYALSMLVCAHSVPVPFLCGPQKTPCPWTPSGLGVSRALLY